ncbi:hypothetical protein MMC20_001438 [Loxospora ochrophaea]|nr:hypothetical protein [Loxospora ochrophaea]
MKLRHLHLPGLTPYTSASDLQTRFVRAHLIHKTLSPSLRKSVRSPPPTLLTFQTHPTYTCGRREIGTLSETQVAYLRRDGSAEFYEALRGGQTTFHGPGQLTAYLILSLDAHALSPRAYVRLLEEVLIETCANYGITGFTTVNPGVWVTEEDKIASVGVHLRRNVASHGVGLNIYTDLEWFDRIVACGLVGKKTTSFQRLGVQIQVAAVAKVMGQYFVKRLEDIEGIEIIDEKDLIEKQETLDGDEFS